MSNAIKHNSLFYWDTITLKVEDELFRVPKKDFTKHSEVFADMFVMPSGDNKNSEGGDDEHPIFLEGYKKNDFIALLKVMYPSSETLLSGTNTVMKVELSKEEWIGVLNLSTRWDMRKVRGYAVHQLSTQFQIDPIEKILLARAHQVAKWLEEGVASLVEDEPKEVEELSALNSWETMARVLSMSVFHTINSAKTKAPEFLLEQLKCTSCKNTFFKQSYFNCCYCSTRFSASSKLKLTSASISGDGVHTGYINQVRCCSCSQHPWGNGSGYYCESCSGYYIQTGSSYSYNVLVDFGKAKPGLTVKEMTEKHFGDEAKEYRITWPDS